MARSLANLIGITFTWAAWFWAATARLPAVFLLAVAIGSALLLVPLVATGRWLLDRQPTPQRAEWITLAVHYLVAITLGTAVIAATLSALRSPDWPLSLPSWLGVVLMVISGLIWLLVIFNLVLRGAGAPFAISLTRQLVSDWLYAWTRNPMVLSGLAFLIGVGLWLRSAAFLAWLLVVASPVTLLFLKMYEERELEIRFGEGYEEYRKKTPMLWPRRPGA